MIPSQRLTGRYSAILYDVDVDWREYYTEKFRARHALVLHAISKGWSEQQCRREMLNPYFPGSDLWLTGEDGRQLGSAESLRRLRADYAQMAAYAAKNPSWRSAAEARQQIGALTEQAAAWAWQGRAGRTDRDVLRYAHKRATQAGCTLVALAARDVSLGAGVSVGTASSSIRRLVAAGWLSKPIRRGRAKAAEYQLTAPSESRRLDSASLNTSFCSTPGQSEVFSYAPPAEPEHEVWLHLGKAASALHAVLGDEPLSARAAAKLAGVHPKTASRNLELLSQIGLAVRQADGWVSTSQSLDTAAEMARWTGRQSTGERRARRYEMDREAFAMYAALDDPALAGRSLLAVRPGLKAVRSGLQAVS